MKSAKKSLQKKTEAKMKDNNHKQAGDPAKAASFLYSIVESGKLPKRILIGNWCMITHSMALVPPRSIGKVWL